MSVRNLLSNLDEEIERIETQAKSLSDSAHSLFKRVGVKEGMNCVDIGCGTGEVALMLAKMVGNSGQVTALDSSQKATEICNKKAKERNQRNITFLTREVYDTKIDEKFDLVYSRFLLEHLDAPQKAITEMLRLAKSGTTLILEDSDNSVWYSYPEDENVQQLRLLYSKLTKLMGGDDSFGRKLHELLHKAGLEPKIEVYSWCITKQNLDLWHATIKVVERLREYIIGFGVVESSQFDQMISGLKSFYKNEGAIFVYPLTFRAIAKTP